LNASQRDSSGPAPGPSGFAQDAGTEPNQPRLAGCVSNEQSELYVPEQLNADPLAALASVPPEKTPLPKIFLLGDRNEANAVQPLNVRLHFSLPPFLTPPASPALPQRDERLEH